MADVHLMVPGAKYLTGRPLPKEQWGFDTNYAGVVFFGFHAMMGTPDGVLHHTQSSKTENRYWYNGVESGEIAQCALLAGHFGIPPILVTGDEATCREAVRFLGKEVVTVAVKKGVNREAAVLYSFEETRAALYAGARRAMRALPMCQPYKIELPIKARMQYLVDGSPSPTVKTREATVPDAWHILDF